MSTILPGIKSKMGNIDYYLVTMPAQELVKQVKILSEDEWANTTVEERYQRKISNTRVKNDIARYLAENKDRFMGSIIVAVTGFTTDSFIQVNRFVAPNIPPPYVKLAEQLGFIYLTGDEILYVLDGQHRIKALEYALEGVKGKFEKNPEIAKDKVTIILIEYEKKRARRIFTKINRYAKSPSTGQTLVTDDDDIVAIIARKIANKLVTGRLTNIDSNTLTEKHYYFMTLPTIAAATYSMLLYQYSFQRKDRKTLPSMEKCKLYEKTAMSLWQKLLEGFTVWNEALRGKGEDKDYVRKELRKQYLSMRPLPQRCIIEAFCIAINIAKPISADIAIKRLNEIPWGMHDKLWDRVLFSGGKIQTKNEKLVTDILVYILRGYKSDNPDALLKGYRKMFPEGEIVSLNQIKKFVDLLST